MGSIAELLMGNGHDDSMQPLRLGRVEAERLAKQVVEDLCCQDEFPRQCRHAGIRFLMVTAEERGEDSHIIYASVWDDIEWRPIGEVECRA